MSENVFLRYGYLSHYIFSYSIHLCSIFTILVFFTVKYNSAMYMHHGVITHSSADGHLDYLHFLSIVNKAAINMDEQLSLW